MMYKQGNEVTLHTDYSVVGDEDNIALSYSSLAQHVRGGAMQRLCSAMVQRIRCNR